MTVLYASRDRAPWTRRDDPEPSLDELLDDPALHALMARDGVDRPTLEAVIADARRKLGLGGSRPSTLEATLFAECWSA
jgi:hypothetical protein